MTIDSKNIPNKGVKGIPYFAVETSPPTGSYIRPHKDSQNHPQPLLFTPLKLRDVTFKNRLFVAPMCQYSAATGTGTPTDWHLVHLGQYAIRGYALVMTEASAVVPNGRISPQDLGIWSDDHIPAFKRLADFIRSQGSSPAIQLAHAGRKSSTHAPWIRTANPDVSPVVPVESGGWTDTWGPSAIPWDSEHLTPKEMTLDDIQSFKDAWRKATERSLKAGFEVVEVHGAHGYLLSEFYSPLSNKRIDKYGGSFENRTRLLVEIAQITREVWPQDKPVFVRISATEWHKNGEKDPNTGEWISWGIEQSKMLAKVLADIGIDLVDVSSAGNDSEQQVQVGPSYQVPLSEAIRTAVPEIKTGSVGLITEAEQAEGILQSGKADAILLARELLRNADFAVEAAEKLGSVISFPSQYERALTRMYK